MFPWNKYPYTDFHELNDSWVIESIKAMGERLENFVSLNSLVFADPLRWNITTNYAINTIVLDENGDAYLSVKPVPVGVLLSNTDYWIEVFNFSNYIEKANKNLTDHYERNVSTASTNYDVNDWLVWDDVLYVVTEQIPKGQSFVIGTNLTHFTVEDFLKDFIDTVNATILQYKNDIDASELNYRLQLANDISATVTSLQAQLDAVISGATVDSEVIAARVGANNVTYSTLGDAIRSQVSAIEETTPSIINGLYNPKYRFIDRISDDIIDVADEDGNVLVAIGSEGELKSKGFNSNNAPQTGPLYTYRNYDFHVQDEAGNIVFGILNGLAITNQFLHGKKVSILGDSISSYMNMIPAGYPYYYPSGEVDNKNQTWWYKLIDDLQLDLVANASWSGSRVSGDSQGSASCGCSDARIADLAGPDNETPDIVLVYISTNDWASDVPIGSFSATDNIPADGTINEISKAYALMLYKIRTTYPGAQIYCITNLEGRQTADTSYPVLNAQGESIHQVNHAIAEIAHIFGCEVIDLNVCGIHYWNISDYTLDGTLHPNKAGFNIIKCAAEQKLLESFHNV